MLLFILFLLISLSLMGIGCWLVFDSGNKEGAFISTLGLIIFAFTITVWSSSLIKQAKVEALVETGKYEIVDNYEYSLKELEQFLEIGGIYLKEVEE